MNAPRSQATLRTERLLLEPLREQDLPHETVLDGEPEVMRFLGDGRPQTADQVRARHRRRLDVARRCPGFGFWIGRVDGAFVGWWLLEPPQRPDQGAADGQAELGYRLLPRFWRRGLGSEGASELVRHGFEDLGLRRIFAETMAVNAPSRATMARVGMRHVRTFQLDWADPLPGADQGEVEYALTLREWRARRVAVG